MHVPFNGSPPAVKATVQDETQMMFAVMQPLQPQIQAGTLRALAVTTAKRFPLLPDLPTIAESGYPGFEALAWNGVLVAAGTPQPIIARLNAEMNAILKEPEMRQKMQGFGFDLIGGTPEEFGALISGEASAMGAGHQEGRAQGRLNGSHMSDIKKVVLAYSGGLDTSVILKWLQDTYGCEVVTFTADIGQGEEVEPARAKALQLGIKKKNIYIEDLREEFVRDFVFPMFRANAVYEGEYLLGTSIARPLIAKRLVEIARRPAPTRSRTAPPARATTRCASSSARTRSRRTSRSSRRGANGTCCRARSCSRTPTSTASRSTSRSARRPSRRRAVFDGRQPAAHQLRRRHPRGSGLRARGIDVADDRVAGEGAGESAGRRAHVPRRRHRRGRRTETHRPLQC